MRMRVFAILFGAVSAATMTQAAEDLSVKEVKALQKDLKSFDEVSVDFTQKRYSKVHERSIPTKGSARFKKPDKFRWILRGGAGKQWIFDGKTLYHYHPKSKSAVKYDPSGSKARELTRIVDLVMNFDTLLKHYELKQAKKGENAVAIRMIPEASGGNGLEKVDLKIDLKREFVSYLRLYFSDGTHNTIEFGKPETDSVPEGAFSLPDGVKVRDSQS